MHILDRISLFIGAFLTIFVMLWLFYTENQNINASFGYTPSVINYTDANGTVWKHTVDVLDNNADSIRINTIRNQNNFNPTSSTQNHDIAFNSQAIGHCTGWMFFETATITTSSTQFSSYLKYCKTGSKSIEVWKTNDTTQSGASHGATTLVATITPTPTATITPTPTPIPSTAPYNLCSIVRENETSKLKWTARNFTYTDSNGITQNDNIQSGTYTCTGDGGNTTQGGLEGLPSTTTGYLNLPTGFSTTNGIVCTGKVITAKGTSSECKFEEKIVNINTVQINGQTNSWHFPVSIAGTSSVSLVYGNSTHALYSLSSAEKPVAMQNNIVLIADKKANEILEWASPNTDTGILKDFITGSICSPNNPCSTERVIFYGGTKEGTSSIILSNKTTKQSVSYTIRTVGSAVKSINLNNSTDVNNINTPISFPANITLFNGLERNANEGEISWEFSSDGGKTYTTSSTEGVISAGKFVAYNEGLFMIRGKIENTIAGPGTEGLKFLKEIVYSNNTISLKITKTPPWNIVMNGKTASWHFPVAMKGKKISSCVYGENYSPTSTPTTTPTPTSTQTSTATPSISASTSPTSSPSSQNTTEYPVVSTSNVITLKAYNPSNVVIRWYSPENSSFGYLQNENAIKCTSQNPCIGNTVQFIGGTEVGIVPVTVINSSNNESFSYTIHTMGGGTQSITIANPTEKIWYQKTTAIMSLKRMTVTGEEEDISQNSNVTWQFSYDGGESYTSSSSDGTFAGRNFTPFKEGSVLVKAILKENIGTPGETDITKETKEFISNNIIAMTVEKPAVFIKGARIIGGNTIAKNATAPVAITLSSRESINSIQSFGVALFPGSLKEENYKEEINPAYIFKEIHKDIPLKEFLEKEGDQNRGIFQLPLFIPEYSSMKDGLYTIVLESYRNDLVLSRYFLPVTLGFDLTNFDINNDGYVSITDAIIALKFANGSLTPNSTEFKRTDKNQNGKIDIFDVIVILKASL